MALPQQAISHNQHIIPQFGLKRLFGSTTNIVDRAVQVANLFYVGNLRLPTYPQNSW
jgi:hypothetical protein